MKEASANPRRIREDAGFTLTEALVSLFVFGIVAAGSVALLAQAARSHEQILQAQDILRQLQTARAVLTDDLAQYTLRRTRREDGSRAPALAMDPKGEGLAFVRAQGEPEATGTRTTLYYVEYRVADGRLTRTSRAYVDAAPGVVTSERVLLTGVKSARFRYFDGAQWSDAWFSEAPPPALALDVETERYGALRIGALGQ